MEKNNKEEILDLDTTITENKIEVEVVERVSKGQKQNKRQLQSDEDLVSCLKQETVIVRRVPKSSGMFINPKHVFYGGMAENAIRVFTVPLLDNGGYVNVLTDSEKAYLEEVMGLEYNALSIYKKEDNYWDNITVRLTKSEMYLRLWDPNDYIKYKILLANKDLIAPSIMVLEDTPKVTYQYVLIREEEEAKQSSLGVNTIMQAYMKFGELKNDFDALRVIVELLSAKPTSEKVSIDFLQSEANKMLQADPKLFLRISSDIHLNTKIIIKKSLEAGLIYKRGDFHYLKSDNSPLCEGGEDPTLNISAKYLNSPKHQEIKLLLEAKLKK